MTGVQTCALPISQLLIADSGNIHVKIDAVEKRSANLRHILLDLHWGTGALLLRIAEVAAGLDYDGFVAVARTLDEVVAEVAVDLVGGYSALVQKGTTTAARTLIDSLPEVLSTTSRVCASVNVGTTAAGINMDAIAHLGHILKQIAERTRESDGFGCAKLVIFANAPTDNPFMAGAFHGVGEQIGRAHV